MGALADMLAKGSSPSPSPDDAAGGDSQKMAEASIKAFFEAGKSGDWAGAATHLSSAIEHCQSADYGGGGGDAADGAGPRHGIEIRLSPHKG